MSGVEQRTIARAEADWRFDRWCKVHFPDLGFGQMQKLLRTGQFRLDGKRIDAAARLTPGQVVRVPPLPLAPDVPLLPVKPEQRVSERDTAMLRSLVIHEDDALIAIAKPAGLAVQGGTGTTRHVDGLMQAFADRHGDKPKLVHRLDRDTSGVLVLAKTAAAARSLTFAFQQHKVRKLYWAVVIGRPKRDEGVIDLALEKSGGAGHEKMTASESEEARYARTGFRVVDANAKVAAWLGLLPLTGRTHQLRAHCALSGFPILGDGKYGGKAAHPTGAPSGLALHARELDLPHPDGGRLRLTAEPDKPIRAAFDWMGLGRELPRFARLDDWPEDRR
ncbi:RluA family pseudouridine synthase [Geminicoccus roseus]|uniref:RluA family pseudouridine synthase n=1 Tax=Geminicoccus roseus TaxID=404900 RepID=UPI0004022667|nr:RluA family pseudouridine synthase [Geminicoccus roseus]